MVSFQWITLSFLLVPGALFAYLIPCEPSYLCHPAGASRCSDYNSPEAARTYFRKDHQIYSEVLSSTIVRDLKNVQKGKRKVKMFPDKGLRTSGFLDEPVDFMNPIFFY